MSRRTKTLFLGPGSVDPESLLIVVEAIGLARQVAARQGPFYSLMFCLRFDQGLAPQEVAEVLGESRNYVNVYTHKLRKRIREEVGALTR